MQLTVDKKSYILSKRYAKAIMELADDSKMQDKFYSDLIKTFEIYQNNPSFKELMALPVVEKNKKKEAINEILKGEIDETVLKFLYVLIDSNRFNALETIICCYKEDLDKARNIINASVVSSMDFKEDMKASLKEKLERKMNKKINIKYSTDESLIAGFILTIGERVVDMSLKNKIKELKKQLI